MSASESKDWEAAQPPVEQQGELTHCPTCGGKLQLRRDGLFEYKVCTSVVCCDGDGQR